MAALALIFDIHVGNPDLQYLVLTSSVNLLIQSSMEASDMDVALLGSLPASVMKASISPTKVVHPGISPDDGKLV